MADTYTKGAYFSPSGGFFCLYGLKASYATWPSDAVAVTDAIFKAYGCTAPPYGKMLGTINGAPGWVSA